MLQFDLQFYEELTVARVKTVKFISGAFFWPTGQLVYCYVQVERIAIRSLFITLRSIHFTYHVLLLNHFQQRGSTDMH